MSKPLTNTNMLLRKFALGASLAMVIFLAGCLDYKAPPSGDEAGSDLLDEIAAIERELGIEGTGAAVAEGDAAEEEQVEEEELTEEVVLPELGEEVEVITEEAALETITIKENELVKLKVSVQDPDRDTVNFRFSPPVNEKGEWKTSYGDAGEYVITITATDGKLTTEKKVKLIVQRVNVPPVIEPLADLSVKEGELVTLNVKASDPNKDEVTLNISPPLSDSRWQTDHTSAGEYTIKVTASDGELKSESSFTLTVHDVNVLPEITNLPERLTVKEGGEVKIRPTVTDADNDPITIRISEPVGDDGIWQTGYTDHGEYTITVTISDGKETITRKVALVVEDVNMAPEITDITLG